MPIYAYRCTNCGYALDVLRKISDPALTDCPACGQPTLVKQVTAAGFQLKGSGWYVTDFRGDKKAGGKPAEGDAAKADGKPDADGAAAKGGDGAKNGDTVKAGEGGKGEGAGKVEPAASAPAAAPAPAAAAPAPSTPGKTGS